MNFLDSEDLNGTAYYFHSTDGDRYYEGMNLAVKFAEEIKKYSDIWQWIKARIKAGNFAGIHVNDSNFALE